MAIHEDFIGAGWAFPLRVNASGGIALVRREHELEEAMRLILLTYPGERPMRPEFGSRLRDYVFRSADDRTAAELSLEVRNSLLRWEPRVIIEQVIVTPDPDEAPLMYIDIQYTPKDENDRRNLVFPFYTIPDDGSDY
jgi:phage baseplate assembly protein W